MFRNSLGIEEKIEMIESSSTRNYFQEVYSSYLNGNYRAAVVTLWSVLVCDAVYKARRLIDLTDDNWAKQEILKIETLQSRNSTSSDWELSIFEGFYEQKKFIGAGEISNIRDIQKKRHLCAHPILSEDDTLYTPNKELVKSMIINALDDFMIRKNYYGKNLFPVIFETLANNSEFYSSSAKIKPLIEKYLIRVTPGSAYKLFKDFWKFSFRLEDADATKHRIMLRNACFHVYSDIKKDPSTADKIKDDLDYFENINFKWSTLSNLFTFLCRQPDFFKKFSPELQGRLREYLNRKDDEDEIQVYIIATTFLFNTSGDYFRHIQSKIESNELTRLFDSHVKFMLDAYDDHDCKKEVYDLVVLYAANAIDFDDADNRFNLVFSDEIFVKLSKDHIKKLIDSFDDNGQIGSRRRKNADLTKLTKRLDELES
ncbi:hypothetical protein ABEH22_22140 [Pantoea agglomerans]|uniref:hypothetical protein n=1 Tax=Enterobacter agglomerans TaxID=549 RepID=UPI0032092AAB